MSTLYDIINILPLPMLAVLLFGGFAGMPEGDFGGFMICLIFSLFVIILRNMSRRNRLRGAGIAAVFLIGLLIAAGEENRQIFLREYPWVIHILCLSAAALVAGIVMSLNIWIRRAAAVGAAVFCAAGTILGWEISKEAFALICFFLLVRAAEEIQRRWNKSGNTDMKEHITRTAPVFLAVALAVYLIPAPAEPYDWQLAKDIFDNTAAFVGRAVGYFTHLSDDYGTIGFSDKGGFLAGLDNNDEEVLVISAGNTTLKNFRLVGCVSGEFTGKEWIFGSGSDTTSRMLDTLETCCAVRKYADTHQSDFMQKTDLYCETLFYNTRYIFSPAKIRLEATREKNDNSAEISEQNGSVISGKRYNFRDNYKVSCYVLNYGNPGLGELLDSAAPVSETEWEQSARAEDVLGKDGYSFADYLSYRDALYADYCHSFDVSEDVAAILDGIKSGSGSRYETAKKLEAYLHGMEYSTDCGPLPASVNDAGSFLDYFLLSSKKGYCMHYATAFVLMANELGIPCRYVQGYSVRRDVSGDIVVKQSDAHAWPEVYFDNAGWVAFEPTPGYSVPTGWGTHETYADATAYEPETDTVSEKDEDTGESEENEQPAAELDPLIFIIPSLAVTGFLLLFRISGISAARRKYRRMSPDEKFGYLTRQNLRYLGYLGFRMQEGETLSEFSQRIIGSDRQEIAENIGFIPVYETLLYSDRAPCEADVTAAEDSAGRLRELAKKSRLGLRLLIMVGAR